MALVTSPLLQAAPLEALQAFFLALVACKPAKTPFKTLLEMLLGAGKNPVRSSCPCCGISPRPAGSLLKWMCLHSGASTLGVWLVQETGKAAQLSIAQCIAVLCTASGSKQTSSTVTKLLQTLQARVDSHLTTVTFRFPVAACLAECKRPWTQTSAVVTKLLHFLQTTSDENGQRLALLTIGEIGRSTDLSSYSNLQSIILGAMFGKYCLRANSVLR